MKLALTQKLLIYQEKEDDTLKAMHEHSFILMYIMYI